MRSYFYRLLAKYIGLYVRPEDRLVELDPSSDDLAPHFPTREALPAEAFVAAASGGAREGSASAPDYVLLNGVLHYQRDIQGYLDRLRPCLADEDAPGRYLLQQPLEAPDEARHYLRPPQQDPRAELARP